MNPGAYDANGPVTRTFDGSNIQRSSRKGEISVNPPRGLSRRCRGVHPLRQQVSHHHRHNPQVGRICPAAAAVFRSGIRRTTRRPGTCSDALLEPNAVNGISATSAREIQVLVVSSKIASVYSILVHAPGSIVAIAALIRGSSLTVTDTSARARRAAASSGARRKRSQLEVTPDRLSLT